MSPVLSDNHLLKSRFFCWLYKFSCFSWGMYFVVVWSRTVLCRIQHRRQKWAVCFCDFNNPWNSHVMLYTIQEGIDIHHFRSSLSYLLLAHWLLKRYSAQLLKIFGLKVPILLATSRLLICILPVLCHFNELQSKCQYEVYFKNILALNIKKYNSYKNICEEFLEIFLIKIPWKFSDKLCLWFKYIIASKKVTTLRTTTHTSNLERFFSRSVEIFAQGKKIKG